VCGDTDSIQVCFQERIRDVTPKKRKKRKKRKGEELGYLSFSFTNILPFLASVKYKSRENWSN